MEIFPAATRAWWRFEEGAGERTAERTGRFPATKCSVWGDRDWQNPSVDLAYNGRSDIPNFHSFSGPLLDVSTNSQSAFVMTNWTFEGVVRILPEEDRNATYVILGHDSGPSSTSSHIRVFWFGSSQQLAGSFRDRDQATTSSKYLPSLGSLPADGSWHHFAVVKTNDQLTAFIDYSPVATNDLTSLADGAYEFDSEARVRVGGSFSGGNSSTENHFFDEIRLSNGVLPTTAFLQSGKPIVEDPQLRVLRLTNGDEADSQQAGAESGTGRSRG